MHGVSSVDFKGFIARSALYVRRQVKNRCSVCSFVRKFGSSFESADFCDFYQHLSNRGYLIYPGKVSNANCFRIGSIGYLFKSDIRALLSAVQDTLTEMQIDLSGI